MNYNILNEEITVKMSNIVRLAEHFTLLTTDGVLDLKVDITADFENIPSEYHEVFINILTAKYLNKVSFGHNPFSKCSPPVKRKWWEFWKPRILAMNIPPPEVAVTQ